MPSNKVLFLVFGVLALVFAVTMSSEVGQESDVISDRRFRWESSEQDLDDSVAHDDAEDDDDQDHSGDFEEIEIWVQDPDSEESSESDESDESDSREA